ncbi:hypothetical protein KIPB_001602 [Kipferlia bialata]|uniref:Protein kinase domain-containing protein n=1 Tax=Kipferlia bialata TaxID=797122 RepID=A0A9K3GFD0_9EUKA|nr:hypothetical protein KIPB_001602 [Kipferlia bialata]|eukprot:g1602.t1
MNRRISGRARPYLYCLTEGGFKAQSIPQCPWSRPGPYTHGSTRNPSTGMSQGKESRKQLFQIPNILGSNHSSAIENALLREYRTQYGLAMHSTPVLAGVKYGPDPTPMLSARRSARLPTTFASNVPVGSALSGEEYRNGDITALLTHFWTANSLPLSAATRLILKTGRTRKVPESVEGTPEDSDKAAGNQPGICIRIDWLVVWQIGEELWLRTQREEGFSVPNYQEVFVTLYHLLSTDDGGPVPYIEHGIGRFMPILNVVAKNTITGNHELLKCDRAKAALALFGVQSAWLAGYRAAVQLLEHTEMQSNIALGCVSVSVGYAPSKRPDKQRGHAEAFAPVPISTEDTTLQILSHDLGPLEKPQDLEVLCRKVMRYSLLHFADVLPAATRPAVPPLVPFFFDPLYPLPVPGYAHWYGELTENQQRFCDFVERRTNLCANTEDTGSRSRTRVVGLTKLADGTKWVATMMRQKPGRSTSGRRVNLELRESLFEQGAPDGPTCPVLQWEWCGEYSTILTRWMESVPPTASHIPSLCRSVQAVHDTGYTHGDLHAGNFLFGECDGNPVVKVIDLDNAYTPGEKDYSPSDLNVCDFFPRDRIFLDGEPVPVNEIDSIDLDILCCLHIACELSSDILGIVEDIYTMSLTDLSAYFTDHDMLPDVDGVLTQVAERAEELDAL